MEKEARFRSGLGRFLAFVVGGLVVGVLLATATQMIEYVWLQHSVVVTLLCVVIALLVHFSLVERLRSEPTLMETPLMLARDPDVFVHYKEASQSLLRISWRNDPIFRDVALQRLGKLCEEIRQVSEGEIVFEGTETWRIVYEQLLRSRGLYRYRSVAWVKTVDYWQDEPGRQSLRLNLELHEKEQLGVERIVIIKDELWPSDDTLPTSAIRQWIHQQHVHGIWVQLVRESQLSGERDLLTDVGIYGSRAVGYQTVNEQGRTVQFTLNFTIDEIERAEERWKRLQVYAISYADLLDHFPLDD